MRGEFKNREDITQIEQLAVRLLVPDIDRVRGNQPSDHLPPIGNIATDGYIALGRRVRARTANCTVVLDTLEIARNGRRDSPKAILKDLKHHQTLNERMEESVNHLLKESAGDVEVSGDFVSADTPSASWFNSERFGYVRVDEYVLLDALAYELTSLGKGEYNIKLTPKDKMPGDWIKSEIDENGDTIVKRTTIVMPPDWVSVVGLGTGDKQGTGCVFDDRAQIAFMVFGALRFEGLQHIDALTEAVELATNLETTQTDASMYLFNRRG